MWMWVFGVTTAVVLCSLRFCPRHKHPRKYPCIAAASVEFVYCLPYLDGESRGTLPQNCYMMRYWKLAVDTAGVDDHSREICSVSRVMASELNSAARENVDQEIVHVSPFLTAGFAKTG